ncbi:phospholipase [Roseibium sp. SCP14]|uniref:luciferase domain-containing protein n=1 Tax=Roseibium sp. SCP14 TaxID=3141375 RepID=UPI0033368B6A
MTKKLNLAQRAGSKPKTTSRLPHSQLTQHGPDEVIYKLHEWCFSLPSVENQHSGISVPGARALVMHDSASCNHEAFMIGREFAHIHPHPDNGSMHVKLRAEDASEVVEKGWGEDHYMVTLGQYPKGLVMVFSPRDDAELETVKTIVKRSYEYANGTDQVVV